MNKQTKYTQRVLRDIAKRVINGERMSVPCGLCYFALRWHRMKGYNAVYGAVRHHIRGGIGYLCTPGTRYEQRAIFALLVAESLNHE